jgi:hypothetical protein
MNILPSHTLGRHIFASYTPTSTLPMPSSIHLQHSTQDLKHSLLTYLGPQMPILKIEMLMQNSL